MYMKKRKRKKNCSLLNLQRTLTLISSDLRLHRQREIKKWYEQAGKGFKIHFINLHHRPRGDYNFTVSLMLNYNETVNKDCLLRRKDSLFPFKKSLGYISRDSKGKLFFFPVRVMATVMDFFTGNYRCFVCPRRLFEQHLLHALFTDYLVFDYDGNV